MREYKVIAVLTALLFLIVAAYFTHRLTHPGAGEFDELASTRIAAACTYKPECKINLSDLSDGDWDTLWEFNAGTPQSDLDVALPASGLRYPSSKRLIVLTQNGRIKAHFYQPANPESYLDHQLVFRDAQGNEQITHLPRNTWLWVRPTPSRFASGEFFYVLTPDNR